MLTLKELLSDTIPYVTSNIPYLVGGACLYAPLQCSECPANAEVRLNDIPYCISCVEKHMNISSSERETGE